MRSLLSKKTKLGLLMLIVCLFLCEGHADIEIHFIDVGQGDATLILCDGEAMLIDAGLSSCSQLIYSYLQEQTDELRYMIVTHPHEDHIGGCAAVLNAVPVGVIYSPVVEWDSKLFANIKKYAELQGAEIIIPYEGECLELGGSIITILHCWPEAWTVNDMSIVLRIDYGVTSFIFTGDAELYSEYMMIDSGLSLKANVLKVAHHGSRSSSCQEFIDAINPQIAVISCGAQNKYGHPHPEVLEALSKAEYILRTDELGTIILQSDGASVSVIKPVLLSELDAESFCGYIGNTKTKVYHNAHCESVYTIEPRNTIHLQTLKDAVEKGYSPCDLCESGMKQ